MATIEERAKESSKWIPNRTFKEGHRFGYMKGAREQRKIDIENACLAFREFLDYLLESDRITIVEREDYEWCDKFRKKAMEE